MRKIDKIKNIKKANALTEQRYLENKSLIKESFHGPDGKPIGVDRNHMPVTKNPQVGDVIPNVDVKLQDGTTAKRTVKVISLYPESGEALVRTDFGGDAIVSIDNLIKQSFHGPVSELSEADRMSMSEFFW
jgi:hypothetical protein